MLKFEVNGKAGKHLIEFPTKITEVTKDYLLDCANTVDVAPDYSLVALLYKQPLAMVLNALKKRDNITASVVPVFVKAGKTDSEFIKSFKPTDRVIVVGSALSLGIHVNVPINELNIERFLRIVDGDNKFRTDAFTYKDPCVFVDFKLLPNVELKGKYNDDYNIPEAKYIKSIETPSESAAN